MYLELFDRVLLEELMLFLIDHKVILNSDFSLTYNLTHASEKWLSGHTTHMHACKGFRITTIDLADKLRLAETLNSKLTTRPYPQRVIADSGYICIDGT